MGSAGSLCYREEMKLWKDRNTRTIKLKYSQLILFAFDIVFVTVCYIAFFNFLLATLIYHRLESSLATPCDALFTDFGSASVAMRGSGGGAIAPIIFEKTFFKGSAPLKF